MRSYAGIIVQGIGTLIFVQLAQNLPCLVANRFNQRGHAQGLSDVIDAEDQGNDADDDERQGDDDRETGDGAPSSVDSISRIASMAWAKAATKIPIAY